MACGLCSADPLRRLLLGSPPPVSKDATIRKGDDEGESGWSMTGFEEWVLGEACTIPLGENNLLSGFVPLSKVSSSAEGGGVAVWRIHILVSLKLLDNVMDLVLIHSAE